MLIFLYEPKQKDNESIEPAWDTLPIGCFQVSNGMEIVIGETFSGIYSHADSSGKDKPESGALHFGAFQQDGERQLFHVVLTYELDVGAHVSVWQAKLKIGKRIKSW